MTEQLLTPTVLLYGFRDPKRRGQITAWLKEAGIRSVEVAPTAYRQALGAVLGLPGFETPAALLPDPELREEMLVMFALPDPGAFLRFFREAKLAPVALKAMITPTNIHWNGLELYEALKAEHAQFLAAKGKREQT